MYPGINLYLFCATFIPSPLIANLIKPEVDDNIVAGLKLALEFKKIEITSNAPTGLLPTFLQKVTAALKFLKNSFKVFASMSASDNVLLFFL